MRLFPLETPLSADASLDKPSLKSQALYGRALQSGSNSQEQTDTAAELRGAPEAPGLTSTVELLFVLNHLRSARATQLFRSGHSLPNACACFTAGTDLCVLTHKACRPPTPPLWSLYYSLKPAPGPLGWKSSHDSPS